MRRHEMLLATSDRNERSIAEAHKDIKNVMQVTDGLSKEVRDIRDEAAECDKKFNELENRLNSSSSRLGPSQKGPSADDEQEMIIGSFSGQQLAYQVVPLVTCKIMEPYFGRSRKAETQVSCRIYVETMSKLRRDYADTMSKRCRSYVDAVSKLCRN